MKLDDLKRFAEDLRRHVGLTVELALDSHPDGLHVLHIDGVDFFFRADGSGYDGWGKALAATPKERLTNKNKRERKGETMKERHQPTRIVIYVSGGIVQDIIAEVEGVEAMIVDYDNEKVGEPKCSRSFEPVPVNRAYIEKTIQGIED